MSGEAGGLILLPLLIFGMPYVLGGLAIAAAASVGARAVGAAVKYERENRKKRQAIGSSQSRTSSAPKSTPAVKNYGSVDRGIGDFRRSIERSMNEQTALNVRASEEMMAELQRQRDAMKRAAETMDAQQLGEYISNLKASHSNTMHSIAEAQNRFNVSYKREISERMADVTREINGRYSSYLGELQKLQADMAAKNKRAGEIAKVYIDEARSLIASLTDEFEGQKFSPRQTASLTDQFNQAVHLYNEGRYEAAIAGAKDTAINALEEIYEADAKKQEWDNYFKLALVLSEEVIAYLESQSVVTEEAKALAEEKSGKKLEDDVVGIKISDYTDKNSRGQTRYDYLMHKAREIHSALRSPDAAALTTQQLKEYVNFINNELYPASAMCINKAVVNMNNAFTRQNVSEEIIDFFEEHNFTFKGYAYDDNCHDKALHIGLENEAAGEELIITLAPELLENGDIQTRVDLKQTKGDEANEERKAYYRQCVEEVVKENNPFAKVELKCKSETRNKLSTDTETKKKLRM